MISDVPKKTIVHRNGDALDIVIDMGDAIISDRKWGQVIGAALPYLTKKVKGLLGEGESLWHFEFIGRRASGTREAEQDGGVVHVELIKNMWLFRVDIATEAMIEHDKTGLPHAVEESEL